MYTGWSIPEAGPSRITFLALVHAVIPTTPELALLLGVNQWIGAAPVGIDQYVVWELEHLLALPMQTGATDRPLSVSTALLLNVAAEQLIASGVVSADCPIYPTDSPFAALSPANRFVVLSFLEQLKIDLAILPAPYTNTPVFVQFMVDFLMRLTMFGFYSEWVGYGTTRLNNPNYRLLQFPPPSWMQTGFPGPANGYRDFRGFLLDPRLGGSMHEL